MGKLCAARADQTSKAEDLSLSQGERHIFEIALVGQSSYFQHCVTKPGRLFGIKSGNLTYNHVANKLGDSDLRSRLLCHLLSIAQHDLAICPLIYLFKTMADKENGHSTGFQVAHDLVQGSNLAGRENGGWFIEDQELRSHGERLCNFDELPLRYAQLIERRLWVNMQVQFLLEGTPPLTPLTSITFSPVGPFMPVHN